MSTGKDREKEDMQPGVAPEAEGATAGGADPPAEAPAASEASLAEQIKKLKAEKEELLNTLVRRQADFENYRKRVEKERHQDRHRGVEALVEHLLPILDAFDRALAAHNDPEYEEYRKGFELIRRQLWDTLSKQGLERIDSAGKEFNPHFHHAIEQVETTEHADGMVMSELQPGYTFHSRVLRPAMVRVATHPQPVSAPASKKEN